MDLKRFKRTSRKDVFDKLATEQDAPLSEINEPTAEGGVAESTDEPDTNTDTSSDDTAPAPRRKRALRRLVVATAALIFLAALGVSTFLGWQLKQQRDTASASREALAVAQTYAVTLTSVDSTKIDENFAQVLDGATGEFKDMYSQSADQLRQVLIDNKANSTGNVVDAAVKSATATRVEVLLFVDQSITNAINPEPRIDRSRVRMTMELVDGRWLASKVEII